MKWSFSYNSFVKLDFITQFFYNTFTPLDPHHSVIKGLHSIQYIIILLYTGNSAVPFITHFIIKQIWINQSCCGSKIFLPWNFI